MHLTEPYRRRAIRPLGQWPLPPFRMKVYGIAYQGAVPEALLAAAREIVAARIRDSAASTDHYGVGFVGVHAGRDANFVFVDWWANENELHHHVYVSPMAQPQALRHETPSGVSACVWDLQVQCFERQAWVDHVLKRHDAPDVEGYLATSLEVEV